jgi:FHS family glucose/mannose:H+ symporter-like MFS transporter
MQIEVPHPAPPVRWLHFGIALTGVGTTLLGSILPALITTWHLKDDRAGLLFAAQFAGSSLGALLVSTNFYGSILRGYFLLIAGAVSLVFFGGSLQVFLFLIFGLGLGLAMTATSMLVSSLFTEKRGAALSLLNASWATGAVLCPVIASLWTSRWPPIYLFPVFAAAVAVTILLIRTHRAAFAVSKNRQSPIEIPPKVLKLLLASTVLAFLYVGVEVSMSGWMMTYVHRTPASGRLWAPIAASGFWIALVCGRALVPVVLRWMSETQLFTLSLTIAFLSTAVLLLSHALIAIVFSVIFAGLVLGPIFPLCMANVLALTNDSPKAKWIFAIPGLGGAALAWMTGKVSAYDGSLRAGLLVPLCTLGIMIVLHRLQLTGGERVQIVGGGPSRSET